MAQSADAISQKALKLELDEMNALFLETEQLARMSGVALEQQFSAKQLTETIKNRRKHNFSGRKEQGAFQKKLQNALNVLEEKSIELDKVYDKKLEDLKSHASESEKERLSSVFMTETQKKLLHLYVVLNAAYQQIKIIDNRYNHYFDMLKADKQKIEQMLGKFSLDALDGLSDEDKKHYIQEISQRLDKIKAAYAEYEATDQTVEALLEQGQLPEATALKDKQNTQTAHVLHLRDFLQLMQGEKRLYDIDGQPTKEIASGCFIVPVELQLKRQNDQFYLFSADRDFESLDEAGLQQAKAYSDEAFQLNSIFTVPMWIRQQERVEKEFLNEAYVGTKKEIKTLEAQRQQEGGGIQMEALRR